MNFENLSREDLAQMLSLLLEQRDQQRGETSRDLEARDRLVYNLQVHQVELEMQNRELRDAQAQLEDAKNRFADLYDYAPVAYYTFDLRGVVREVNLTGASMVGKPREYILQLPFTALVKFDSTAIFHAHLDACARKRGTVVQELSFRTARGTIYVEAATVPVFGPEQAVTGFRTTFSDVSRRKTAERERERAYASEQKLRARFEALDETHVAMAEALATERGDMRALLALIAERARATVSAERASIEVESELRAHTSDDPASRSGEHSTPNAELRGLDVPVRFRGRTLGKLSVWQHPAAPDLSSDDRRTLEMLADRAAVAIEIARLTHVEGRERQRLQMVERATQALAGVLDIGTVWEAVSRVADLTVPELADAAMLYVYANGALVPARARHRVPEKQRVLELVHDGLRVPREHPTSLLAESQRECKTMLAHAPFDLWGLGEADETAARAALRLQCVMVVPLVARQRLLGALCLGLERDGRSYEHGHLAWADELALACAIAIDNARLFAELQAAVRSRDTLLALVSHDLRGPLNAITLSASALDTPQQAVERRRAYKHVNLIKRSAQWMKQMVDDLLLAGQLSEGHFVVNPQRHEPAMLLYEAVEFATPQAMHKGVRLECSPPAQPCLVNADADRLRQVFLNLLGNAIKFTPSGGSVWLRAVRKGDELEFSVTDTGPGIPVHELPHVFDCYWTGEHLEIALRKRAGHGLGLGLFITKGIVEAHGGRIWVNSKEGQGTTFSFTLQALRQPSAVEALAPEDSAFDLETSKLA